MHSSFIGPHLLSHFFCLQSPAPFSDAERFSPPPGTAGLPTPVRRRPAFLSPGMHFQLLHASTPALALQSLPAACNPPAELVAECRIGPTSPQNLGRASGARETLFGLGSPLFAPAPSRKPMQGRFFAYTVKAGASQVGVG